MSAAHSADLSAAENPLVYPFEGRPGDAELMTMRPGVQWLRMPVPIPGLNYINLWLLEDGDGWTIIDTGLNSSALREIWSQVFERHLAGRPVRRLICTHFHPDHLGLAGWLQERWQAPLWMTLGEYSFGRMLALEALPEVPADVIDFYQRLGFGEDLLAPIRASGFGNFRKAVGTIPRQFHRISDGDAIMIGERQWRIIIGRGHSPEHACLHCAEDKLLISGDQILPRISPHIGVYPGEPEADPLSLYLNSFAAFAGLADDTLVLPAHGDPFIGLHRRITELKRHHAERLEGLLAAMDTPKTVVELLPAMFKRDIKGHMSLAAGEALAHLHLLLREGRVTRDLDAAGVYRFKRQEVGATVQ